MVGIAVVVIAADRLTALGRFIEVITSRAKLAVILLRFTGLFISHHPALWAILIGHTSAGITIHLGAGWAGLIIGRLAIQQGADKPALRTVGIGVAHAFTAGACIGSVGCRLPDITIRARICSGLENIQWVILCKAGQNDPSGGGLSNIGISGSGRRFSSATDRDTGFGTHPLLRSCTPNQVGTGCRRAWKTLAIHIG